MTRKQAPTAASLPLDVHLYATRVAELSEDRKNRVVLTWTDAARERWGIGGRPLSLALPISQKPIVGGNGAVAFTEGLLPEGSLRIATADLYGVPSDDALAILEHIGAECAGAVQVVPADTSPPEQAVATKPVPDDEVAAMLRGIDAARLGNDNQPHGVRLSLAGAQPKILLARVDGQWCRPVNGAPSTHIIKPESRYKEYVGLPENEAFCMALARHAGVPTANSELVTFDGITALAVERFDRRAPKNGAAYPPLRRHMEDMCSAWGLDVYDQDAKYNQKENRLARVAETLRTHSVDPQRDIHRLAQIAVLNVVIGNADAHGRNFSVLIDPRSGVHLAPAYDLVSTVLYPMEPKAAMTYAGKQRIKEITLDHLVHEIASWSLSKQLARSMVADQLDRIESSIALATTEVPDDQGRVASFVQSRLNAFTITSGSVLPGNTCAAGH